MIFSKRSRPTQPSVLGVFSYPEDLRQAATVLKGQSRAFTAFGPAAPGLIPEIGKTKPSPVRYYTLAGGLLGLLSGFSLAHYTVQQWKFVVSGKPVIAWIPFVIVGFEFLILFGVIFSFTGMLIHSRLPGRTLPAGYDPRFSNDRFGLLVPCRPEEREKIAVLLNAAGAEEIHDVAG